jgi:hypothetical protein
MSEPTIAIFPGDGIGAEVAGYPEMSGRMSPEQVVGCVGMGKQIT